VHEKESSLEEVDWLVAGSGAAGMTGAVVAHELGGSVLVVEKEPMYGGTTTKSGGVIWVPGNQGMAQAGIDDSTEEGYAYLKGLIGDTVSDARIRAYAERAREMLAFMTRHSHIEYTPLPSYMDYYETVPGYKAGGRSMDPTAFNLKRLGAEAASIRDDHYGLMPFSITVVEGRQLGEMNFKSYMLGIKLLLRFWLDLPSRIRGKPDQRVTLGPAVVARLRRSLMDRDIPLWLGSPMRELIVEEGRVAGAIVERKGERVLIRARRGVLLATGGFSHNVAMRREYQQGPVSTDWTGAAPGATGDGILMGKTVGAALDFMGSAWWSPTYRLPDNRSLALIAGKGYPRSIMVNKQGRRFTNEAQPYEDVVKDQYASELRGESAVPCYLVFDSVFRSKYPVGHIRPGKLEKDSMLADSVFESGLLTRADTLAELAAKLDIDGSQLQQTVARFNEFARQGEDPDFGRGVSEHDRYYADKNVTPNPCLGPLEQGPFYAMRCDAGDLDTKGGLACDEHGQVLDESAMSIPGLYAAGNTSAAAMGDTYPGAGATIGSAMTFAYLAARRAFQADTEQQGE
jgi:3-oxosteroid 1-dehydrogenase